MSSIINIYYNLNVTLWYFLSDKKNVHLNRAVQFYSPGGFSVK